jgi:hypothetical protein
MQCGDMFEQIRNFIDALGDAFIHHGARLETKKNWMATKNSKLLQYLEYYWNHDWSKDKRIKLVICGSSAGWILSNIVNNKKGLYNRVTNI